MEILALCVNLNKKASLVLKGTWQHNIRENKKTIFPNQSELINHEDLEHGFNLDCQHCDFKCKCIEKLLHHDGSEHGIKSGQWDCNFTTRGSKYNPSEFQVLTEHMEKMHCFKCNYCEDGFESQEQLNNHIKNDHSDSDDESESG